MSDEEHTITDTCEEDEDSDGWDEMEISGEQTTCLFCSLQFHTIAVALDHCRMEHNFDLLELKTKYNMDCYSFIKMVNYIRLHKPSPKLITESPAALWDDDLYLKPGEMESWLMYDFDDLGSTPSTPHYAIDGKTPISHNFSDLQKQIFELTLQLKQKDSLLQNATQDMEKMRKVTRSIVESGDTSKLNITNIASVPVHYDKDYFNSYSHFGIHHEMLSDGVRTESYRDAILKNDDEFRGKTVLDVGCGTAILSMFAARAGAKMVYGIDQSEIIYKAMDIIRENNVYEQIHLIRGRLEDTTLPVEKVDVIVSEWMGYFLLFEGMLDTFLYARDKHLAEGGLILPNRCTINLVGCSDLERHKNFIKFWDDVYGFSMSCMKSEVCKEPNIETVPCDKLITTAVVLSVIDLSTCTSSTAEFVSNFNLTATENGKLTALAGYFDTYFDLKIPVSFSTGPGSPRTHWQQTVFYLENPIDVEKGETIEGTLSCRRKTNNVRRLLVTISLRGKKYEYNLD